MYNPSTYITPASPFRYVLNTKESIDAWLQTMRIQHYTIDKDLSVSVQGYVGLSTRKLSFIPVQFNIVEGDFNCDANQLLSLEGAPKFVGGSFDCSHNQLNSLEHSPRVVEGDFRCDDNFLRTLKGAPKKVGEGFFCSDNVIKDFKKLDMTIGEHSYFYYYSTKPMSKIKGFEEYYFAVEKNRTQDSLNIPGVAWNAMNSKRLLAESIKKTAVHTGKIAKKHKI